MSEDIASSGCGMRCDSSKVAHRCSLANTFPIAALTSKRLAREIDVPLALRAQREYVLHMILRGE